MEGGNDTWEPLKDIGDTDEEKIRDNVLKNDVRLEAGDELKEAVLAAPALDVVCADMDVPEESAIGDIVPAKVVLPDGRVEDTVPPEGETPFRVICEEDNEPENTVPEYGFIED